MSSVAETPAAGPLADFMRCLRDQRAAHAYLVIGPNMSAVETFIGRASQALFCSAEDLPCGRCSGCRRANARTHPDQHRVEPESKSRSILIPQIRALVQDLGESAYEGGWKVAVIMHADRMNTSAANALLKTLEEPPGRTILFLGTESASSLLPTILSRCQRILADNPPEETPPWQEPLEALLAEGPGLDPLSRMRCAAGLENLLADERTRLREEREADALDDTVRALVEARIEGDLRALRARLLRAMMDWQRDLLFLVLGLETAPLHHAHRAEDLKRQAGKLDAGAVLQRLRAIETMARRLEGNLPLREVLDEGWRALEQIPEPPPGRSFSPRR